MVNPRSGIDVLDSSTTPVSERILARVKQLRTTLPTGVELRLVRDAGVRVQHSLNDIEFSLCGASFVKQSRHTPRNRLTRSALVRFR